MTFFVMGYRQRCHYEVARLQRLFESETKTHTRKVNTELLGSFTSRREDLNLRPPGPEFGIREGVVLIDFNLI
jgi:hypothetical protein